MTYKNELGAIPLVGMYIAPAKIVHPPPATAHNKVYDGYVIGWDIIPITPPKSRQISCCIRKYDNLFAALRINLNVVVHWGERRIVKVNIVRTWLYEIN